MKWGKDHCLSQAKEEGWLDSLREQVRSHPWHVRMRAYAAHWTQEWSRSRALPYPSFRQWEQAAEEVRQSRPRPRRVRGPSRDKSPSRVANGLVLVARRDSLVALFDMSEERVAADLAAAICALSDDSRVLA